MTMTQQHGIYQSLKHQYHHQHKYTMDSGQENGIQAIQHPLKDNTNPCPTHISPYISHGYGVAL